MLCQICNIRPANVQITQIINNNRTVMFICDTCAKEKRQLKPDSDLSIGSFLSGMMESGKASYGQQLDSTEKCKVCGYSFADIKRTGKMGCSNCYKIHGSKLLPIIKRIHGSSVHKGSFPEKYAVKVTADKELETLKSELSEAIKSENYEKAAKIRDLIKEMSMNKDQSQNMDPGQEKDQEQGTEASKDE